MEFEVANDFKVDELDAKITIVVLLQIFFCSKKNKMLELEFENEFKVNELDDKNNNFFLW